MFISSSIPDHEIGKQPKCSSVRGKVDEVACPHRGGPRSSKTGRTFDTPGNSRPLQGVRLSRSNHSQESSCRVDSFM